MALGGTERNNSSNKHRGFYGLLCGTINVSCIGDSSVIEKDDDNEAAVQVPVQTEEEVAPAIPSPVLVSKKLAEEAVAKRNVQLKQHQTEETNPPATEDTSSFNTPVPDHKLTGSRTRQKRMAPAPPVPVTASPMPSS